ncbi:hypothetical protein [Streptomyces atratus]|uniref:hypothetical protein n=1 Tax=Streptomyces atratus TaxID=1893 RepID=UPI0022595A87|nr:hypothetical protein [Streptomyces atratus]MCX5342096.1 hypothetical protein [Streptomyces atratus]
MRQLSAPVRWAAVIAVTVAASTGCMSVGDDGGKPAPPPSSGPKGSAAGPDGGTVAGTGGARHGGGGAEAHSEREAAESAEPSGSAGPSGSPGGVRPGTKPGDPRSAGGGGLPVPSVSQPGPGVPHQPESPPPSEPDTPEPPASPEPEPSEPSPQPSASSAAQLRKRAMRALEGPSALRTPDVSPQVGPV